MKNVNRLFVIIAIIILVIIGRYFMAQNEVTKIPEVTAVTNEQTIETVRGSYCWHSAGVAECFDTAAPHEMILSQKTPYVKVQPGEVMEFQYSQNVTSVSIQQWIEDYDYKEIATSTRFTAPMEKGTYIISSMARFSNGDVTDSIAIEVE